MKKYIKIFFINLLVLFSLYSVAFAAEAPTQIDPCKPEEITYQRSVRLWDLDIRRTVDNFITSTLISGVATTTGANPDTLMECQGYVQTKIREAMGDDLIPINENVCNVTGNEDVCGALTNDIAYGIGGEKSMASANNIKVMSINSSLLGMSNTLENFSRREPLPVNLAYYWNQSISNIPFINEALAADPSTAYKNVPVVAAMYGVWKISTQAALALMSVILLYTGIMIVMRKKVSSQLVVNIQYAIPKIVIAILLIIFSYPIGAIITSVGWGLYRGAFSLVFRMYLGAESFYAGEFLTGLPVLQLILTTLTLARGGPFYVLMTLIVALILSILKIVIYFKALLIYIKMAFAIVTAPLEFTFGAVPGNDDKIKDWFLKMGKYCATLFAMGLVIPITLIVAMEVQAAYMGAEHLSEVGGMGIVISIVAPLLIVIIGFSIGINMENKVKEMFGAPTKRK